MPRKTAAKPAKPAKRTAAPKAATVRPKKAATPAAAPGGVCPRCGTSTFAPEQRTRIDGNRTVRYSILVCERGHTFAKPAARFP